MSVHEWNTAFNTIPPKLPSYFCNVCCLTCDVNAWHYSRRDILLALHPLTIHTERIATSCSWQRTMLPWRFCVTTSTMLYTLVPLTPWPLAARMVVRGLWRRWSLSSSLEAASPETRSTHRCVGVGVWRGRRGVCVGVQRGSSSLVLFHDDVISFMCNVMVGISNWRVDGTTVKVL